MAVTNYHVSHMAPRPKPNTALKPHTRCTLTTLLTLRATKPKNGKSARCECEKIGIVLAVSARVAH
eukprot:3074264-Prymnesium_polylepis.1